MDLTPVQKKARKLKELELDRRVYQDECKEITQYILPSKGLYLSEGEKPHDKPNRFAHIISPIATEDNELLAAGIQGGLSSQSRPWFRLQASEPKANQLEHVQVWLDYVQNRMYSVLASSNFYSKVHDVYNDEGAFGNGVIIAEPDLQNVVRFRVITPGTYCFSERKGVVDTLYLRYPMRALNVFNRWGDKCSDDVKQAAEKQPYKWVQICHAIEPNLERDPNKIDYLNLPYSSCYWEHGKPERFLSQGGYYERPFAVGRWRVNDIEAYATGPGHVALGLVKMLQSMEKTSLKAIHKEADPPLRVPTGLKDVLNTLPGGVNYISGNDPREAISRLYEMNFDYKGVEYKIERITALLHMIFKRDLFLLITDRPEMTATEVIERSQEKLIMIGPVTERQIPDVLEPVLTRTFNIMNRLGMIPPPPTEIAGRPLKFDYVSLLAQAQKMMGLQGMRNYLEVAARVAEIQQVPSPSNDKTDFDYFLDEYATSLALPPQLTRDGDTVAQIRQRRAQQEEQMRQSELLKQNSESARNLSQAQGG